MIAERLETLRREGLESMRGEARRIRGVLERKGFDVASVQLSTGRPVDGGRFMLRVDFRRPDGEEFDANLLRVLNGALGAGGCDTALDGGPVRCTYSLWGGPPSGPLHVRV